jgi:hypothetical protein
MGIRQFNDIHLIPVAARAATEVIKLHVFLG